MPAQALSSRLFFRAEPIGTITIDSLLRPVDVLGNLRERGWEWRESSIPDDLKKVKAGVMTVEIDGSQFEMQWGSAGNPFFNPVCFGIVQPYGDGSRIRAGFKLSKIQLRLFAIYTFMAEINLFGERTWVTWLLFGFMTVVLLYAAMRYRNAEPMRSRLIEALSKAAHARIAQA